MGNKYSRLTLSERKLIEKLLARNCSFNEIAEFLDRSVSTVSNEIGRGGCNRYIYQAGRAERRAGRNARKRRRGKSKLNGCRRLRRYIFTKIRLQWSPVQIAESLKTEYPDDMTMRISPESIYTYIYVLPKGSLKKELLRCLRHPRKRRHYRRNTADKPEVERKIEDMISIEERPKDVENRIIPGHWEGDLIIGKNRQSALGTLVERTTRMVLLVPLKDRKALTVADAFAKTVKRLPAEMRLSLTYDQGREMAAHKLFTGISGVKVYFAHPRSPWERGTNENTNGLIRQYFPKGTDFNQVTVSEIKFAQHRLNGRPRKALGFRKPYEVFKELINQF
ncbi:MAG: IS30 family transposase [bacterium]